MVAYSNKVMASEFFLYFQCQSGLSFSEFLEPPSAPKLRHQVSGKAVLPGPLQV